MSVKSGNSNSLIPRTVKRPPGVHQAAQRLKARGGDLQVCGEALETLQHGFDVLFNAAQQPLPSNSEEVLVTAPGGGIVARIGTLISGATTNHGISFYGPDGKQYSWLGIQEQLPKAVTNVTNAGGLIRITSALHGFSTRDTVLVTEVQGVLASIGAWIITVIDPNTFDLATDLAGNPSVFAGTYTGGGKAARFYAGALFSTLGIGTSFPTAKLRCFANGDLEIDGATFELALNGITTEIQNLTDALVPAGSVGVRISQVVSTDTYKSLSHSRGLVFAKNTTELAYISSYGDFGEVRVDHPSGANATLSTNGNIARCVVNGTGSCFTCDAHDGVYGTFTYSKPGGGSGTITVTGGIVTNIT